MFFCSVHCEYSLLACTLTLKTVTKVRNDKSLVKPSATALYDTGTEVALVQILAGQLRKKVVSVGISSPLNTLSVTLPSFICLYYELYCVKCTVYCVHFTLYTVKCTLIIGSAM